MEKTLFLAVFALSMVSCSRDDSPAAAASSLQGVTLVANAVKARQVYTVPDVLQVTVPDSTWQPFLNPYRNPYTAIAFSKRNQAAVIELRTTPAARTPTAELAEMAKRFFQGTTISWHWEFTGSGQQPARIRYVDSDSEAAGMIDVRILPGNSRRLLITIGNWTKSNERLMRADYGAIVDSVRAVD